MVKLTMLVAVLLVAFAAISTVEVNATVRVIGGVDAKANQFPYQISLRMHHQHKCGGSIISEKFILTAALCVAESGPKPHDAKYFTVRAGTHNRIAGGVIVQVKRVIVNQNNGFFINDVALLKLEQKLIYSPSIQPIELATEEVPSDKEVIISGWGVLVTNDYNLPIMLKWS